MNILKTLGNIFDADNEDNAGTEWQDISRKKEFDQILKVSSQKPQVIYKHSTRCATSYFALRNLESVSSHEKQKADFFMVDVIARRPMSVYITDKLGIRHESPQLFIIKDREVIWHGSHHQVQAEVLISKL